MTNLNKKKTSYQQNDFTHIKLKPQTQFKLPVKSPLLVNQLLFKKLLKIKFTPNTGTASFSRFLQPYSFVYVKFKVEIG